MKTRCCINRTGVWTGCISGDSECTQCPTSHRPLITAESWSVNYEMLQPGPSHGRCIFLKHRVAILRPKKKEAVSRNLTACMDTDHMTAVVSGWSLMKHICTKTHQWVATLRLWKVAVYRNLTECMGTVTAWFAAFSGTKLYNMFEKWTFSRGG